MMPVMIISASLDLKLESQSLRPGSVLVHRAAGPGKSGAGPGLWAESESLVLYRRRWLLRLVRAAGTRLLVRAAGPQVEVRVRRWPGPEPGHEPCHY